MTMSKTAWILGTLLVVTNGLWIARERSRAVDDSVSRIAQREGLPRAAPEPRAGTPREARAARPEPSVAAPERPPETKPAPPAPAPKTPSREDMVRRQALMNEWRAALTQ